MFSIGGGPSECLVLLHPGCYKLSADSEHIASLCSISLGSRGLSAS